MGFFATSPSLTLSATPQALAPKTPILGLASLKCISGLVRLTHQLRFLASARVLGCTFYFWTNENPHFWTAETKTLIVCGVAIYLCSNGIQKLHIVLALSTFRKRVLNSARRKPSQTFALADFQNSASYYKSHMERVNVLEHENLQGTSTQSLLSPVPGSDTCSSGPTKSYHGPLYSWG